MMLHPPPSDADLSQIYDENYLLLDGSNEERQHFSDLKLATARAYLDLIRRCLAQSPPAVKASIRQPAPAGGMRRPAGASRSRHG